MRALLTLSSLQVGGAERNVVSVLPHLQQCGIDVGLCTLGTLPDSFLAEELRRHDVPRFDLGARRLLDPIAFGRLMRLLRTFRPDVIHGEDQYASLFSAASARLLGIPFVYTRHNEREDSATFNQHARAQLTLRGARGASRVIAVSEAIRRFLAGPGGVSLERIETIHNGIDLRPFAGGASRALLRQRHGWSETERVVLMVAVVRKDKGHDVLFDAIRMVRNGVPDARFKIVGDGPWLARRRSEAADLSDCVEFLGNCNDVPDLLMAADLLVSPSWTEALPTAPIEAGAAGLPVVATDVGGTREIVEHGVSGYLVASGDAGGIAARISEILADRSLAARLGGAARERVGRTVLVADAGTGDRSALRGAGRRPMKILYSLPHPSDQLGVERAGHVIRANALLAALERAGHEVVRVEAAATVFGSAAAVKAYRGFFKRHVPRPIALRMRDVGRLLYTRAFAGRLMQAVQQHGPDIILETNIAFSRAGALASRKSGVPLVLDDLAPPLEEDSDVGYGVGLKRRAMDVFGEITRQAALAIAVSGAIRQILLDQGVDAAKIAIIPNGVDAATFNAEADGRAVRLRLGIPETDIVIVFVGCSSPSTASTCCSMPLPRCPRRNPCICC